MRLELFVTRDYVHLSKGIQFRVERLSYLCLEVRTNRIVNDLTISWAARVIIRYDLVVLKRWSLSVLESKKKNSVVSQSNARALRRCVDVLCVYALHRLNQNISEFKKLFCCYLFHQRRVSCVSMNPNAKRLLLALHAPFTQFLFVRLHSPFETRFIPDRAR